MSLPFQPEPGDIIFTSQGSPLSWLIRFNEGDFRRSHVFIVGDIDLTTGRWAAYTTGGKRFYFFGKVDLETYLQGKSYAVQRVKGGLTGEQKTSVLNVAETLIGRPYNTIGVLQLAMQARFGEVFSLFRPHLRPPYSEMTSLFCAQSVALIYWLGLGLRLNKKAGKLDPSPYDLKNIYFADETEDVYKTAFQF
jgi:hypothetical protein